MYDRKENIIKQAIETERQMYAKILEKLRAKLVTQIKERNDIISKIEQRQTDTVEIRKEVNELMVKSKLLSEEDAKQVMADYKDATPDLPPQIAVNEDKMVWKLNSIIKTSKKKIKVKKNKPSSGNEVPTTKNAFNLRRKGAAQGQKKNQDELTR